MSKKQTKTTETTTNENDHLPPVLPAHQAALDDTQAQLNALDAKFLSLVQGRQEAEDGTPLLIRLGNLLDAARAAFETNGGAIQTALAIGELKDATNTHLQIGADLARVIVFQRQIIALFNQSREVEENWRREYEAGANRVRELRRELYDRDADAKAIIDAYTDEIYTNIVPILQRTIPPAVMAQYVIPRG